MIKIKEVVDI